MLLLGKIQPQERHGRRGCRPQCLAEIERLLHRFRHHDLLTPKVKASDRRARHRPGLFEQLGWGPRQRGNDTAAELRTGETRTAAASFDVRARPECGRHLVAQAGLFRDEVVTMSFDTSAGAKPTESAKISTRAAFTPSRSLGSSSLQLTPWNRGDSIRELHGA